MVFLSSSKNCSLQVGKKSDPSEKRVSSSNISFLGERVGSKLHTVCGWMLCEAQLRARSCFQAGFNHLHLLPQYCTCRYKPMKM